MSMDAISVEVMRREVSGNAILMRVSDESVDRFGTIVTASGYRLENYRKNPVILNGHRFDDVTEVIGCAPRTWIENGCLMQVWEFAVDANPKAVIAHRLYAGGYCRAASVRFIPIRSRQERHGGQLIVRHLEQELTEVSACGVGINANALARALGEVGAPASVVDAARAFTQPHPALSPIVQVPNRELGIVAREVARAAARISRMR